MKDKGSGVLGLNVAGWVFVLLVIVSFQTVNAAVLALYQFETSPGRRVSADSDANSSAANLAYTGFTPAYGTGGSGTPPSGDHLNISMNQTPNSQGSDYFSFTVNASPNFVLNLNTYSLTFQSELFIRSGTTGNWALRSSLDNFGNNLTSSSLPADWGPLSYTFNDAAWNGLSGVTFRVYFWDSVNTTDEFIRFDNVTLNGLVVPEPVNVALGVFGAVVGFVSLGGWLRKRKAATKTV